MGSLLDDVTLETDYSPGDSKLGKQLLQVARVMKTRANRSAERDFFFVNSGGYDTHSNGQEELEYNFLDVNNELERFVTELKAQGIYNNVVLMTQSDFGRTLTSNGAGTDHAWAGHYFILGGGVQGGRVLNDYPSSLLPGFDQDAGRGHGERSRLQLLLN